MIRALLCLLMMSVVALSQSQTGAGDDILTAIEVFPNRSVEGVAGATVRPNVVYKVSLREGEGILATIVTDFASQYFLHLLDPRSQSIFLGRNQKLLTSGPQQGVFQMAFDVPSAGVYFFWLHVPNTPTMRYSFEIRLAGQTTQSSPPSLNCTVRGAVSEIMYLTGSTMTLIEIQIGTTKLCDSCSVKLPVTQGAVDRLDLAWASGRSVEICVDSRGIPGSLRLLQ